MNQCRSIVERTGERCSKNAARWSQYCWHHRETGWLLGFVLGLAAIAIGIAIAAYQERSPFVTAECQPSQDGDPSQLVCMLHNSGRKEARDVVVSFTNLLPLGTKAWATDPDVAIHYEEAEIPPDPILTTTIAPDGKQNDPAPSDPPPCSMGDSAAARLQVAFQVTISRIPPDESVTFHVATGNPDNLRAAKQTLRIREIIAQTVRDFADRVRQTHPEATRDWKVDTVLAARVKEENFFMPGTFTYEGGRFPVTFFTEEEELAKAINQDLYARYKQEFLSIFNDQSEFLTPVIRIRTSRGDGTYAPFPPYVNTYIQLMFPMPAPGTHGTLCFEPPVPASYL